MVCSRNLTPLLLLIATLLSSCAGTEIMRQSLAERPANLQYLHERATHPAKSGQTIYLQSISNSSSAGSLTNERWYIIPLVFYWHTYSRSKLDFFEDGTTVPFLQSMEENLAEDIRRHTPLTITEDPALADFHLLLSIDSLSGFSLPVYKSHTLIIPIGPFLIYQSYNENYNEGGLAHSSFSYQLYDRQEELLLSDRVSADMRVVDFSEQGIYVPQHLRRIAFHGSIVTALSQSFKDNIRQIISELNQLESPAELKKLPLDENFLLK